MKRYVFCILFINTNEIILIKTLDVLASFRKNFTTRLKYYVFIAKDDILA